MKPKLVGHVLDYDPIMSLEAVRDFLFGKPMTPEEAVKKWRRELSHESRLIDRNIRGIEREEQKVLREIKVAAKRGDKGTARTLAREIVRSRKSKERMYKSKAELNSVSMHLQQNLATYKLAGCLKKSADVMKMMNHLIKLPQLNQTMMMMAREMEKAGLIEEMIDDMMDNDDEIEDEANEEVDKVMDELALDVFDKTPNAPVGTKAGQQQEVAVEEEEEDEDMKKMRERYDSLKGGL